MATPLPILADVTQQFTLLRSKLASLLPKLDSSITDTVKKLKDLADGVDTLKDGVEDAADSFDKLNKSAAKLTTEYEKQEKTLIKFGEVQTQVMAHLLALQAQAQTKGGSLFDKAIDSLVGAFKSLVGIGGPAATVPAAAMVPPAAAAAAEAAAPAAEAAAPAVKLGLLARARNKFYELREKAQAIPLNERFATAADKGAGTKFSAPLGVFSSLKSKITDAVEAMDAKKQAIPDALLYAAKSAKSFDDSLVQVKATLLQGIAPAIDVAANMMRIMLSVVQPLSGWLTSHAEVVKGLAAVLLPLVGLLVGVAKAIQLVAWVTELWGAAQALFNVIMAANPLVLVVIGLAALAAGLYYAYTHFEKLRNMIHDAFTWIKSFFSALGNIVATIKETINNVASTIGAMIARVQTGMELLGKAKGFFQRFTGDEPVAVETAPSGAPGRGFGLASPARASATATTTNHHTTIQVQQLGATTFHVDNLDKKHAATMRDHVHKALVGALQDVNAPSPALG